MDEKFDQSLKVQSIGIRLSFFFVHFGWGAKEELKRQIILLSNQCKMGRVIARCVPDKDRS